MITVNDLTLSWGAFTLLDHISIHIGDGEKIGLVGKNGAGKSTLLKLILGEVSPTSGNITKTKGERIGYLPQMMEHAKDKTVMEETMKAFDSLFALHDRIDKITAELSERTDYQSNSYNNLIVELNNVQDRAAMLESEPPASQAEKVLIGLGFKSEEFNRPTRELSQGWNMRIELAKILLSKPDCLLLDEPTNHLDITTITWLQNYLKETKRSVLMVTHDRYFLDAVCTNIYELARNKLKLYQGNYSQYLEKKETEAEIEENTERRIESVLRFERDWLLRGPCARGTKIKARIQRDEQLINREKFQADKGFTFEVKGKRLGGKVLELHNISKNYPKGFVAQEESKTIPVIGNFSYKFTKGQKIGIFGDNGSGKTTFLNIVTGNLKPDTGNVEVGLNTKFGYYTQNPQFKDTNLTVLEYIKETAERMTLNDGKKEVSASRFLEEFGFEGKIQHSPVSTLSGGERKRLYLVRLLLENPNFLILDEPTNDFDIFTMNILEQFLMNYEGCLLLVSHDRYFMDKTVDSLFILEEDGSISGFVGKCSEYIEYREELRQQKEKEEKDSRKNEQKQFDQKLQAQSEQAVPNEQQPASATKKKLTFKEQKEFEALDTEIPQLEKEKTELEAQMSIGDFEKLQEVTKRYKEVCESLENKYARWEELAEKA